MHPAKEYLLKIRRLQQQIDWLEEEIEKNHYLLLPEGIRYDSMKVQTSLNNTLENAVIDIMALLEKQIRRRTKLAKKRDIIIAQIGRIPEEVERKILKDYYVDGLSLSGIAKKRNYSYDYIAHEHGQALNSFAHIILKKGIKQ